MTKQLDMVYSLLIFYRIAITYANTYYNILNINITAFPNLRIFLFFFIAYFMVFLACTRYCGNIVDATNLSAQLIQRHAFHFALHRVILSKHDETHGSSSVI